MSEKKAQVIIISGFSGTGKGTLVKEIMRQHPSEFALSVSCTTRGIRVNETADVDYHYISQEKFDAMVAAGEFLEYAGFVNNSYGTPKAFVEENLDAGRDVILEIELQGARQIKKLYPDACMIFITAPTGMDIFNRLTGRGTEDKEKIIKRMTRAIDEADGVPEYEHILVNDQMEASAITLYDMIRNPKAHEKTDTELALVKQVQAELRTIVGDHK